MLRRFSVLLLILLTNSILFNSCKKDKAKTDVIIEYPIALPDLMEIDTLNVDSMVERETFDFPTTLEGELAKNNTTKAKIKSAQLVFMRLQVMDYAYADSTKYSNLRDIAELELDIKKEGIGQALIARKSIPDVYVKAVNLDLENVDLKDYLKADNFRMAVRYKKRRPMPNDMPYVISIKFRIVADPL